MCMAFFFLDQFYMPGYSLVAHSTLNSKASSGGKQGTSTVRDCHVWRTSPKTSLLGIMNAHNHIMINTYAEGGATCHEEGSSTTPQRYEQNRQLGISSEVRGDVKSYTGASGIGCRGRIRGAAGLGVLAIQYCNNHPTVCLNRTLKPLPIIESSFALF